MSLTETEILFVAKVLQVVGVLTGLASVERTILGRGYSYVRGAYKRAIKAFVKRQHTSKSFLERQNAAMFLWVMKHRGARQIFFACFTYPRYRSFFLLPSYLIDLLLRVWIFSFLIIWAFRLPASFPQWLWAGSMVVSILWVMGVVIGVLTMWSVLKSETERNGLSAMFLAIGRTVKAHTLGILVHLYWLIILITEILGMLPVVLIPDKVLPLRTPAQRNRYMLNVGGVYIVLGLLIEAWWLAR